MSTVICGVCNAVFRNTIEYEEHIKSHKSFRCNECKIDFTTQLEHEGHLQMNHTDEQVIVQYIECQKCDYKSENPHDLDIHRQLNHMSVKVSVDQSNLGRIECSQCEYKCKLNMQLKVHTRTHHVVDPKYKCKDCKFTSNYSAGVWEHMISQHPDKSYEFNPKENENIIIKVVAEQNNAILEEMENMKKDFTGAFEQLAGNLSTYLKGIKEETNDNCKTLADAVIKLHSKIAKLETIAKVILKPKSRTKAVDSKT